mmetsp:Transcript_61859/g.164477  ORF Transcript_61859/g.164477 Transcript_61859/m.164477 type:complete len:268 (-) Transcript_61859:27-830(-)
MSSGKSKMITCVTPGMSTPLPSTSVATSALMWPLRNAARVDSRCSCFRAPCITPQRCSPKWCATSSPSSSAATRVRTKISAFPGGAPTSPPRAPSRWRSSSGSFLRIGPRPLSQSPKLLSITSIVCVITRGGSARPLCPEPSAPPPRPSVARSSCASSSGRAKTFSARPPRLHRRQAACSTSGGQVAEKNSIWRSGRISAEILVMSSSKPKSSMRSPSSSTKKDTRRRRNAEKLHTRSSSRPGVATTMCTLLCRRSWSSCSTLRVPP